MAGLHVVSLIWLLLAAVSAALIAADVIRRPQHMWIMNVVWPMTALYAAVAALWAYAAFGRAGKAQHKSVRSGGPTAMSVAKATSHCGAGCTLGDIVAEWLAFYFPGIAIFFGWHGLFAEKMFAVWVLDYILAFVLGIAFQYFTIVPMRKLSMGEGVVAALKADALSLSAWQIGMYGFMALARFYLFPVIFRAQLRTDTIEFWFMMQLAMLAGFATAYPVNRWLIKSHIKEEM